MSLKVEKMAGIIIITELLPTLDLSAVINPAPDGHYNLEQMETPSLPFHAKSDLLFAAMAFFGGSVCCLTETSGKTPGTCCVRCKSCWLHLCIGFPGQPLRRL